MMVLLGVLSESFSSSPQKRKVSFPSARTWFDKFRGLSVSAMSSADRYGFRCVPGGSHIHTCRRAPCWSEWSRVWSGDHVQRLCSTQCAGCQGTAGEIQGRWSSRITLSSPHSVTHQRGKIGQTRRMHWGVISCCRRSFEDYLALLNNRHSPRHDFFSF